MTSVDSIAGNPLLRKIIENASLFPDEHTGTEILRPNGIIFTSAENKNPMMPYLAIVGSVL